MEGRPLEDAELIERARRGDSGSYGELVRRYQQVAVRTAYVVAGDAADAEEAAQEAFVKAYRALDRFRGDAPFRPWLLAIVANEARNRRRAAGRQAALALRAAERGRPSGDAVPSPEEAVLGTEERERLLAAVNSMGESDRMVIAYRFFLDLSERETAEALGVPAGTVKSRLSRALERLRARLESGGADEGGDGG
ncbi:MAG TPA: sigma-70 family RNA polymerase sigma factor [Actinomycetota bacterium]|nr:sigma-70 family RNA polymerase sigma factor [Actinomycetota bacterium]